MRISIRATVGIVLVTAAALAVEPPRFCFEPDGPAESVRDARPASWAEPVAGVPGVENLFRVSDQLYRGAQPEDEGFAGLRLLGVKTVVNLRRFHSDRAECRENGLEYVKIPVRAWEPTRDELVEFLSVVTDSQRQPVFVHCKYGADRTGLMVAVYRIVVQGWSKDSAIDEMTDGGYGFHSHWHDLTEYVRDLRVDGLLEEAGVPGQAP